MRRVSGRAFRRSPAMTATWARLASWRRKLFCGWSRRSGSQAMRARPCSKPWLGSNLRFSPCSNSKPTNSRLAGAASSERGSVGILPDQRSCAECPAGAVGRVADCADSSTADRERASSLTIPSSLFLDVAIRLYRIRVQGGTKMRNLWKCAATLAVLMWCGGPASLIVQRHFAILDLR